MLLVGAVPRAVQNAQYLVKTAAVAMSRRIALTALKDVLCYAQLMTVTLDSEPELVGRGSQKIRSILG
jgi:hypothetical protein